MLPLVGSIDAVVTALAPVVIHGDRYVDLALAHQGGRDALRVALHLLPRHPEVGDRVRVRLLLGQVDAIELLERSNDRGEG
jgi:hypothetical protein